MKAKFKLVLCLGVVSLVSGSPAIIRGFGGFGNDTFSRSTSINTAALSSSSSSSSTTPTRRYRSSSSSEDDFSVGLSKTSEEFVLDAENSSQKSKFYSNDGGWNVTYSLGLQSAHVFYGLDLTKVQGNADPDREGSAMYIASMEFQRQIADFSVGLGATYFRSFDSSITVGGQGDPDQRGAYEEYDFNTSLSYDFSNLLGLGESNHGVSFALSNNIYLFKSHSYFASAYQYHGSATLSYSYDGSVDNLGWLARFNCSTSVEYSYLTGESQVGTDGEGFNISVNSSFLLDEAVRIVPFSDREWSLRLTNQLTSFYDDALNQSTQDVNGVISEDNGFYSYSAGLGLSASSGFLSVALSADYNGYYHERGASDLDQVTYAFSTSFSF